MGVLGDSRDCLWLKEVERSKGQKLPLLHTKQGDGQSRKSSSLRKTGDDGQQDTMPTQRAGNGHGPVGIQSEEAVCSEYRSTLVV